MTREEAIDELQWGYPKEDTSVEECLRYKQAIDMAISALSENKGDLISRQTVLDLLQMKYSGKELYKAIYELPSAENKGEWKNEGEWRTRNGFTYCTLCGFTKIKDDARSYNFCPCCGNPMITTYTPYKAESEVKPNDHNKV